jgi:hypothetical protein
VGGRNVKAPRRRGRRVVDGNGDMNGIGENSRFRSFSSPPSSSSLHFLFTAFLIRLASGRVVRVGEGPVGGAGGLADLETVFGGLSDGGGASCTSVAARSPLCDGAWSSGSLGIII